MVRVSSPGDLGNQVTRSRSPGQYRLCVPAQPSAAAPPSGAPRGEGVGVQVPSPSLAAHTPAAHFPASTGVRAP